MRYVGVDVWKKDRQESILGDRTWDLVVIGTATWQDRNVNFILICLIPYSTDGSLLEQDMGSYYK